MKNETALMIRSIQFVLANKTEGIEYSLENIDWRQFSEMSSFHSIRPILYQFLKNKIANKEIEDLKDFSINQTFLNLQYSAEIRRLLNIFDARGIQVLPFKGVLFIHELYKNNQIREVGDMDFLFPASQAKNAMEVFFEEGYDLALRNSDFDYLPRVKKIDALLDSKNQNEVSFKKNNLAIDFHWGLCYGYLPYKVNAESFFENATKRDFYGERFFIPAHEDIFFMLLLHHGGKENWTRMKHFADLIAFLNTFGSTVDWSSILKKSKDYRLYRQMLMGFYLLEKYFKILIPAEISVELKTFQPKSEKRTIKYWDKAQLWSSVFPRLRQEIILCQNQDEGFSIKKYLSDFLNSYTIPHPVEDKNIWVFSDKYPYLNFISKVLTYLIRKFR